MDEQERISGEINAPETPLGEKGLEEYRLEETAKPENDKEETAESGKAGDPEGDGAGEAEARKLVETVLESVTEDKQTAGSGFQMYTLKAPEAPDRTAKPYSGKEKERKTPKKKSGFFQKALLAVSLGLLFGLFAGMGIYAVMEATGSFPGRGVNEEAVLALIDEALAEQKRAPVDWEHAEVTRLITSDVSEMVAEVIPAMVCIVNNYLDEGTTFFGQSYSEILPASGSGIIVEENDTELLIATNYHVVEGTVELDVTFIDGSEAEAQVKGTDPEMDLAVIAVPLSELEPKTRRAIGYAKLGDSDSLVMGQPVIALGNALGYGQSMTGGYVSAPEREVTMEDGSTGIFIQTDAAINPGNSGGALLNLQGEVIGINSSKIGGTLVDGVGFAIPISAAEPIIGELKLKETRFKVAEEDRGYIGIVMAELDYQFQEIYGVPEGAFVKEVNEGSPAQEAGILPGDVVVALGEDSVSSIDELQGVLEYYSAGTTTSLTVMRLQEGVYQEVELTITLGEKPASMR